MPFDPVSHETIERYAAIESVSIVCAVVLAAVTAGVFIWLQPPLPFAIGSLLAGMLVFLAWRAALVKRPNRAAVMCIAAIALALASIGSLISVPLPELMSQGLTLVGLGFFAPVAISRVVRES